MVESVIFKRFGDFGVGLQIGPERSQAQKLQKWMVLLLLLYFLDSIWFKGFKICSKSLYLNAGGLAPKPPTSFGDISHVALELLFGKFIVKATPRDPCFGINN